MDLGKISTDLSNKYRLDRKIGEGSFGVVIKAYLASNPQECVAIKKSNLKGIDVRVAKYIREESILLRQCDNKNIIKYIDHVDTPGDHYLIMEYCPISIKKFWKAYFQKRMPENILLVVFKQIVSGLQWIHQNRIIHRDIKLENIMINISDEKLRQIKDRLVTASSIFLENVQDDLIKIIDFGVSKNIKQAKFTQTLVGSPLTLAPEILSNQQYGFEVDIYSLGVIMFLLITGDFPYNGEEISQIYKSIQKQEANLDDFPDYSKGLKETILQMLKLKTDERLTFEQLYEKNPFKLEKEEQKQKSQFYKEEKQRSRLLSTSSDICFKNQDGGLNQRVSPNSQTSKGQIETTPQKQKKYIRILETTPQSGQLLVQSESKILMLDHSIKLEAQSQQYQQPQYVQQSINDQMINGPQKYIKILEETSLIDQKYQPPIQVHQHIENNVGKSIKIISEEDMFVISEIHEQPNGNQQQLNQNIDSHKDLQQDPETITRKTISRQQFRDKTKTRISNIFLEKLPKVVQDQLDCFCAMYDRCTLLQQACINLAELPLNNNKFQKFLLDMCFKLNQILWSRMCTFEDENDKIIQFNDVFQLYRNVNYQQKEIENSQHLLKEPIRNDQQSWNMSEGTQQWYDLPPTCLIFIANYQDQLSQIMQALTRVRNPQILNQILVTEIFVLLCYRVFDMENLFWEQEYCLPSITDSRQSLLTRFRKLRTEIQQYPN